MLQGDCGTNNMILPNHLDPHAVSFGAFRTE